MTVEDGSYKGVIRIQGQFPALIVKDRGGADTRHEATLALFREVIATYADCFAGLSFDFFICTFDNPESCNVLAERVPHVLTYSVTSNCLPNIRAIPDFVYGGWPEAGIDDYAATASAMAAAGQKPPQHDKVFWIGNALMHETRLRLLEIGQQYPQIMEFITMAWREERVEGSARKISTAYISLPDQVAYSQLLDIRGSGYSGRLKLLLHAGRPLFLVDRPFREFFFDHLQPYRHYMPVSADLSDLVTRVEEVRNNPALAQRLGREAASFAAQYLTRDYALTYLRDLLMQIGRKV